MTPQDRTYRTYRAGLRDHVAEHWQTLLQHKLPKAASVPPLEHDKLSCAARVAALDAAIAKIDGPIILVAHSAGVMITVHWAQQHDRQIHGALLATPADLETPLPDGYPTLDVLDENGWHAIPAQAVAVSEHPRGQPQRSARRVESRRGNGRRTGAAASSTSARLDT